MDEHSMFRYVFLDRRLLTIGSLVGAVIIASFAGSLPPALLYALTGAAVANLESTALMFGIVLLIAGLFWLGGMIFTRVSEEA